MTTIRANTVLPAERRPITLATSDGLRLVGELALPEGRPPRGTIICLHPLPTAGGMMDSHVLRKASWRLPALADIAVLRFNTRGTRSAAGTSEGTFDGGRNERFDVEAALAFAAEQGLPDIWVVGWSFGTDLALRYARSADVQGLILLSPPLRFSEPDDLTWWAGDGRPVIALVPEHDDFLRPAEARARFDAIPQATITAIENGKHLWVGETLVSRALSEIVARVNPDALPLPTEWEGPYELFTDLEPIA
jgi:alpha/beta superfamily hydrolase